MIVRTSQHPEWSSNAYLVADRENGHAVFIDAGAPIEPLLAEVERLNVKVSHVLLTHEHSDHTLNMVELSERYGAPIMTPILISDRTEVFCGDITLTALATPGHCREHFAWAVSNSADGETIAVFSGDALFKNTVGGTINGGENGLSDLRESIMRKLLTLPSDTVIYPGHKGETTVAKELANNPFVRAWSDSVKQFQDKEFVHAMGARAEMLLEAPDYDGGSKVWVRFEDGREAIVGGSMVDRI